MRQHGNQRWSGHRELTTAAVDRLYAVLAGPDGRIRGLGRDRYAAQLDRAQAHQDRPFAAGLIRNFANTGRTFPYAGLGPTLHSAYTNPDVQRQHFLADPFRSGPANLRVAAGFIATELRRARRKSGREMMRHLGAAVHAMQDSYSGAHAWRDYAVYSGDPTAAVRALHVFTPAHLVGIDDGRNTHAGAFDQPPARSGTVRAAVEATYRILTAHELGLRDPGRAELVLRETLEPLVRASDAGVVVGLLPDTEWRAERDRRLELDKSAGQRPVEGGIGVLSDGGVGACG
ncbi:hypothetical protein BWI15_05100 [Kribbella sp. ALI-6-A]|uniref:hypothetical protein n=1 Tax=Kribbella sp. ALI-6-A TaxID=1933817 RepID=UPI00097BFC09|nr:hypothetical protein [Kribbella sp. ALI-6-A]ONI76675.1 hypothetical protein BWI15_05100 [Kribbella sp. ALI-6-A]